MVGHPRKIVLLGMLAKLPVAGVVWQTMHYLVGLERLGFEAYYVEAHGILPTKLMEPDETDGADKAAAYIDRVMRRFGFERRWAYHARHAGDRVYGLSEGELKRLYGSADLILNLHGGTQPLAEHAATGRLVYLETDPVESQVQLHERRADTVARLDPHGAFFTFAENYSRPGCGLPVSDRFLFRATRQPVVLDFWTTASPARGCFTTVGNWKQKGRDLRFRGQIYRWSKHHEWLKVIDLPGRSDATFELALSHSSMGPDDRELLERRGWRVTDALAFSTDPDAYRQYIVDSRGEFTVAKDQNIRLRTGWFSDRSATYLAAGRPVVTQDTGFGDVLPTGEGLFAFSTLDDAAQAIEEIDADYERHSRAARVIAREYFDHAVVLGRFLADVGLRDRHPGHATPLQPSRRPPHRPSSPSTSMRALVVAAARPNFMKVAPLLRALQEEGHQGVLVHTGQHYDTQLSDTFFADLGLPPPDFHLGVGSGTHADQTARVMLAFEPVLQRVRPEWVVVVGDVNSTLACALVAAKLKEEVGCRIAHVEAGLRSGDWRMPEEVNRVLTDRVSDLLLTPSGDAAGNLLAEGIPPERVAFVGNIMIDTLLSQLRHARAIDLPGRLGLTRSAYTVVTLQRPSNVDSRDTLAEILDALAVIAGEMPVVFPLHPRTRKQAAAFGLAPALQRLTVIEPCGYREMLSLVDGAAVVLTDSGGLQEETTVLGVPCVTLREQTERPVTIAQGTNRLIPWPPGRTGICASFQEALAVGRQGYGERCPEGWDGHAAGRVVEQLAARTTFCHASVNADVRSGTVATPYI
jgi:UDP-N-acetylglucosamine 2-epimerase (non-hydrolysing)